jgi:hypothetical protein
MQAVMHAGIDLFMQYLIHNESRARERKRKQNETQNCTDHNMSKHAFYS